MNNVDEKPGVRYKAMVESIEPLKLQVLPPAVFKEFAAATPHEIHGAAVRNTEQGIVIVLNIGNERRILGQYRGGIRFFRSFDGAAAVLRQHGVLQWTADATGWIPRTLEAKERSSTG
ncbi:ParC family partition-associated protein [Pseudomonas aeruginosa]|uniref:ParC family partition-associated protein n=1 Tax=Pseudomonas aeruginosa TaxID=287 RepID=UPI0021C862AD|nr:ParC family partition-associated protein [Pseudomonas aeruginosa]